MSIKAEKVKMVGSLAEWAIIETDLDGNEKLVCFMTSDEILELYNETVPRTKYETYMVGREECKHAWRPWKFNESFVRCANCPAMQKVIKLVPRGYQHGSQEM